MYSHVGYRICDYLLYLLVFVLLIDPTNTILGAKEIVFFLFVLSSLIFGIKPMYSMISILLFCFIAISFSILSGLIQGFSFDWGFTLAFFKSFLFLLILFFVQRFDLIPKVNNISIIIAAITLIVAFVFLSNIAVKNVWYSFFQAHDSFIMVNEERKFVGYTFPSFFYKTSPVLVLPLSFAVYNLLAKVQVKDMILSILFFTALILSGTRANMFSAILIIFLLLINRLFQSHFWRPLTVIILCGFILFALFVTSKLLLDLQNESINIKYGHISAIFHLFKENPFILLFGQGVGSVYYTSGFLDYTPLSELSYLEIIRMFGIFSGFIMISIFIYPLYYGYQHRKQLEDFYPFFVGYLAYLFIGGTNPLLIGSTGFLVLATAYSFVLRKGCNNIS